MNSSPLRRQVREQPVLRSDQSIELADCRLRSRGRTPTTEEDRTGRNGTGAPRRIGYDTAMLMRVFRGWLRSEPGHCGMIVVPTIEEEDAKRPCRERENLVGERTRVINRLKPTLVRFGICGFRPQLRKAPQLLESLRTPEDSPIPPLSVSPGSYRVFRVG
jgi:hypothetical protein